MKKINFICVHCEKNRKIDVKEVQEFYIVGNCSVCKSLVKINLKRLNPKNKFPLHAVR